MMGLIRDGLTMPAENRIDCVSVPAGSLPFWGLIWDASGGLWFEWDAAQGQGVQSVPYSQLVLAGGRLRESHPLSPTECARIAGLSRVSYLFTIKAKQLAGLK
jgi:hypothetical protein